MEPIQTKYRRSVHPVITAAVEESVQHQLHIDISIYDNGGIYKEIEGGLKELFPREHLLTVSNGTSALYSMFFGAGIQPGDEVIVPAYTFFATAMPLFQLGAVPVLADCQADGNSSPQQIEAKITPQTKAVVITHMWGIPCDMEELSALCKKHNVLLLEDCSHAHGATYKNHVVGTHYSDAAAWSLQGKKLLTSGEGGFVATDSSEIFERAVLLGHFNKRAKKDVSTEKFQPFVVTGLGGNLRMHPLGAAVLRPQLGETFRTQLAERRETAAYMTEELKSMDGLTPVPYPEFKNPAWYAYPILFDAAKFTISIDDFVKEYISLGAEEADIPGSTCPLNRFKVFLEPWKIFPAYAQYQNALLPNSSGFPAADAFHSSMFKLSSWYGPERMVFAEEHMRVLRALVEKYRR